MVQVLIIVSAAVGWLLLIPAGLLIWEMNTPSVAFTLLPPAYDLMFGSLLALHFGAKLGASKLLAPARAPRSP